MSKNIVICCDGTGNEIGRNLTNVMKLYRIVTKSERQRVYYDAGVGTIGQLKPWQRSMQNALGVFGLATGYGLEDDVLDAYRFLCAHHEKGDDVWLFGFSRGAYAVRILAGFIRVMGLLPVDQLNLTGYAFAAYRAAAADDDGGVARSTGTGTSDERLKPAWDFSRIACGERISIKFVGVWDTVASVIAPHKRGLLPGLQTFPFTHRNPSVRIFRHAISIDERRRMFRLHQWDVDQPFKPHPNSVERPQDARQVWFSGVHADVGGGYPEAESGLSKYPLIWMIEEARAAGLEITTASFNHFAKGKQRKGSAYSYVEPDPKAPLHRSLVGAWRVLEWLPKHERYREWSRRAFLRRYLPRGEPRPIPNDALIHHSVIDRMSKEPAYKPGNVPVTPLIEYPPPLPSKASKSRQARPRARTKPAPADVDAPRDEEI